MKMVLKEGYNNKISNKGKIILILCLFFLLLFISIKSLATGTLPITITEVFSIIFKGSSHDVDWLKETVIWYIRMPRILMSILAGISLGIAGSLMQGVLRNPLASPYTIGIASGAGFGASLGYVLCVNMVPVIGKYLVIGFAFLFALISSLFILYLANRVGVTSFGIVVIPILGIGLACLFATLRLLIQFFFDELDLTINEFFWNMSSLGLISLDHIVFNININNASIPLPGPVPAILIICCILLLISLFILKIKDFDTIGIGVKPENNPKAKHIRIFLMVIASLLVASIVSFTGPIAFIGLIAPHLAYISVGRDNRLLLPASALIGALLVVIGDIVGRCIISPVIVDVSAIVSLIGIPLFIYLLIKIIISAPNRNV